MADTKTASRARRSSARRPATASRAASAVAPTDGANGSNGSSSRAVTRRATRPVGGVALDDTVPAGAATTPAELGADVTDELGRVAPTFGNVLSSIGLGVATSQTALDKGLVDSVQALSDKKIKVVTDVIQTLDDDGLPDLDATELVTSEVSVLNFITPTVHEWKYVRLAMDLEVGEIDNTQAMTFKREQVSIGYNAVGMFWGFLGWFDTHDTSKTTNVTSSSEQEVDWSQGQVRVDALLAPREADGFTPPANVDIGPRLYFSQGSVTDTTAAGVRTRSVKVRVKVLKASGAVNPAKNLVVEATGLGISFTTGGGFNGSTTNTDGEVEVTLSRVVPVAATVTPRQFPVTASLGQVRQSSQVTL
ncbi:hypothetical protein [Intrasporangium flavum]|uniref:hypothetical protein n=1 Tax=Intrasporangium flavum TaxID=1428657 RepID=UPI001A97C447|nr:hypothetical protein [Intrasporangium flavum]